MAKLPSGWVFIPHLKKATTITIEQRELVTCRHCKHYFPDDNGHVIVYRCDLNHERMRDDFFCADMERDEI